MLAYTGLETVANLAAEAREPGRTLPRSLFVGIGAAVVVSFLIAMVGALRVSRAIRRRRARHPTGCTPRWSGIADAFDGHLPDGVVDVLRVFIGLTGVVILVAVITTSISGAGGSPTRSAGTTCCPHAFGRLEPQDADPPAAISRRPRSRPGSS